jgi:hypothetical protein
LVPSTTASDGFIDDAINHRFRGVNERFRDSLQFRERLL